MLAPVHLDTEAMTKRRLPEIENRKIL